MKFDDLVQRSERGKQMPLNRQIYERIRAAIGEGRLKPGERLPSVRSLASQLNLARGTVEAAYQQLVSEGYLVAKGPAGTLVSHDAAKPLAIQRPPQAPASSAVSGRPPEPLPLQLGLPALDAFPRKTWVRLATHELRRLDASGLVHPDTQGLPRLRESVARYLGIARDIRCDASQVFITSGYRGALTLICRTLLKPNDAGWFEEPGYLHARTLLTAEGMQLVPVPVDHEGICVQSALAQAPKARFALVTPTHQSPLGVSLSLPRRLALLEWADARKAWIIEDDYDSEYRYRGRPIPALKSLDRGGRVLYCGTFSKVLFPGLRLGYLVVPPGAVERFRISTGTLQPGGPELLQACTAEFIDQGHFSRHLRRMRTLYAERRDLLIDALHAECGQFLHVDRQAGGMHLVARLSDGLEDMAVSQKAFSAGLSVQALSRWYLRRPKAEGLLLGFTNVPDQAQATALGRRLRRAFV